MADRVHPHDSVPSPESPSSPLVAKPPASPSAEPQPESPTKPAAPPAHTYVIKIPKDQVFRVPPPQNAKLFERYSRRDPRQRHRCCCISFLFLAAFIFLAGTAAGIFYLVVKPEAPSYSVTGVSITGLNLTLSTPSSEVSPEFVVAVRAVNRNDKMGIYHVGGSSVRVYYAGVKLGDGVLPVFHMPSNSETAFNATVTGRGIVLGNEVNTALVNGESQGSVQLNLKVRAPVKFKVGAIKTWKITVKLSCDITVDKLTAAAKILSQHCDYGVKFF